MNRRKTLNELIGFLVVLALVIGGRYYYFVEHEENIYSEVGLALHSLMPRPVKEWGCKRLSERFAGQSPQGCYVTPT